MKAFEQLKSIKRGAVGRWFYGRQASEQKMLAGFGLLITVSVLWVALWNPLSAWRDLSFHRHQNAQQLHTWLLANEAAAQQSSAATPSRARSLTPIITRAATSVEMVVSRLQPEPNGVVSVVLQQQQFNKIVAWLAQMEENNGVSVERASVDSPNSSEAPGYVNAQLRLN